VDADIDIAAVAAAIGHPTRATFLTALNGGQSLAAGELARRARISPQAASEQLARLVNLELVQVKRAGRQRQFSLASAEVAAALEALALIAPTAPTRSLRHGHESQALRAARTCYDHLAGTLGVDLTEAMVADGWIAAAIDDFGLRPRGERRLGQLGLDLASLEGRRRPLTRACLDWSERRPHLAGALGAALAGWLLELGWLERLPRGRAVRATEEGRRGFDRQFGFRPSR
jgi:DNA-binding transcriptional ArsR family regulator